MAALMVLVLVPVVFTALCMVTQLGTSNLQMCSLLIRTRARHGCLSRARHGCLSPAAIAPGVASSTVSGVLSISEFSAALDSVVVSLPRFGLKAAVSTQFLH